MNEWRLNQEVFRRQHGDNYDDLLDNIKHVVTPLDVMDVVRYFTDPQITITFPAKSFSVAIIYATLIEHFFGDPLREVLSDPMLLGGNDKYFTPYPSAPGVYEEALGQLSDLTPEAILTSTNPNVKQTVNYFRREVMLSEE